MASGAVARKSLAIGPSVRNLISQYKLDPSQIASTGPHQTLLKQDVLSFISLQKLAPRASLPSSSSSPQGIGFKSHPQPPVQVLELYEHELIKSRYPRRLPSQLEIDVINNGGRLD